MYNKPICFLLMVKYRIAYPKIAAPRKFIIVYSLNQMKNTLLKIYR